MALVADSIGGTKHAPAQMSWHLRHLKPALLNRQGISTHPKMENGSELCHWKGQLMVGLCVNPDHEVFWRCPSQESSLRNAADNQWLIGPQVPHGQSAQATPVFIVGVTVSAHDQDAYALKIDHPSNFMHYHSIRLPEGMLLTFSDAETRKGQCLAMAAGGPSVQMTPKNLQAQSRPPINSSTASHCTLLYCTLLYCTVITALRQWLCM